MLHIDLSGRDPDDGMTQVPYEKGALFLRTLEHTFGRARFDAFLRSYFDEHVFKSITTADFEAFLRERLFRHDPAAAQSIDLAAWLERPGLPQAFAEPRSVRLTAIDQMAKDWNGGSLPTPQLGAALWSTQEWLRFLQALPEKLPAAGMTELDQQFHLTGRGNSEIAHQWLLMSIANHYQAADSRVESYLTTIGRRNSSCPCIGRSLPRPKDENAPKRSTPRRGSPTTRSQPTRSIVS